MRLVLTADLHLKMWEDSYRNENGDPMKLIETIDAVDKMCKYAIENKIKYVVIAGDIGDLNGVVHARAFILLKKLIQSYNQLHFYILAGNHDATSADGVSAIELLDGMSNVTIIVEPLYVENISFIPWTKSIPSVIKEAEGNDVLISHFALTEGTTSSGMSIRTSISLKMLSKFKLVVLGDYHKPQEIDNVIYVGSPIQLNRGESGESKRFLDIDTDTLLINSIPIEGYREYVVMTIDDDANKNDILQEAIKMKNQGHRVTIKNKLNESIDTDEEILIVDDFEQEYNIRGISSNMNLNEQCEKYLEIREIPTKNREEYLKILFKVL